jgi:hypothetical protein
MNDDTLTSRDFYYVKERKASTVILTILMIVIVLLILYIIIVLASKVQRPCSGSPVAPTNPQAGYVNTTSFRVSWNPILTADSYVVYVGQTSGFARTQAVNVTASKRSYANVVGLPTSATYYIYVTAKNACGESPNSQQITFVDIQS